MGGATSYHGVNRDNFNFECNRAQRCGTVNGVGGGKVTGHRNLLWFSVKYLSVIWGLGWRSG